MTLAARLPVAQAVFASCDGCPWSATFTRAGMICHGLSGSSADGEAPGWFGATLTVSLSGRILKRSGGSRRVASPSIPAATAARESISNAGAVDWRIASFQRGDQVLPVVIGAGNVLPCR